MRHQLGNPTWFCSFSAAETRWSHLLKTMGRLVEKEDYTDCEIENMAWQQKSDLIQKDLGCNLCQKLWTHGSAVLKDVLKSDEMPIREIVDFFLQVEWNFNKEVHLIYMHYFG